MKTNPSAPGWKFVDPARGHGLRWFIGVAALLWGGCASSTSTPTAASKPSVLVAVQVAGGAAPTPAQSAAVLQVVAGELARAGYRVATRADSADFEVVAIITPDAIDSTQGAIKVSGVQPIRDRSGGAKDSFSAKLDEARQRQSELDTWARSREAPIYSSP